MKQDEMLKKAEAIQRDTVAEYIDDTRAAYAGRQQMQVEFSIFVDDDMAGVGAALETHDNVERFGQQVNHPAFSFVAPVDSDDRCTGHRSVSFRPQKSAFARTVIVPFRTLFVNAFRRSALR